MSEILDLLPIPEERDFPAGHLDARRDALVAAIREPFALRAMRAGHRRIAKVWLSLLGIAALGIALLTLGVSAQQRPVQKEAVAFLAAAGTAQVAIAFAPRLGHAA